MTDPGKYIELYTDLPADLERLVALVQGLVIDKDLVSLFGLEMEAAKRLGELDTRYLTDIYARLLAKDDRALQEPRDPSARFIGSCRDYALVLCSLLRQVGVPARLRFGFATYFSKEPEVYGDHCVCEYWDASGARWVLVDANVDPVIKASLGISADHLDLGRDQFVVASDAWKLARGGTVDPARFGVRSINISGLWFIRGSLMRDLAALNKVEMLPWDYWGIADKTPVESLPPAELPLLDELALALDTPDHAEALRSLYARDALRAPTTIKSYSPLSGPTEVTLRF